MITQEVKDIFLATADKIEEEVQRLTGRYDIDDIGVNNLIEQARCAVESSNIDDYHALVFESWAKTIHFLGNRTTFYHLEMAMSEVYAINAIISPSDYSNPNPYSNEESYRVTVNGEPHYEADDVYEAVDYVANVGDITLEDTDTGTLYVFYKL